MFVKSHLLDSKIFLFNSTRKAGVVIITVLLLKNIISVYDLVPRKDQV